MISEIIKKYKLSIMFFSDIIIFLLSLVIVLYLRYGNSGFSSQFLTHKDPFTFILFLWLIIFYIFNLYTYKAFNSTLEIFRSLTMTLTINFLLTITIFYIFSRFFNLTPKFNLIFFTIVFGILDLLWRYILRIIFIKKEHVSNILILASSPLVQEVTEHINKNPQLGYSAYLFDNNKISLKETIKIKSINLVIIDSCSLKNNETAKILYSFLPKNVEIVMFTDFYESLFNCVPLSEIEEEWFVRKISENKNIYESIKHLSEIIFVCFCIIILVPFLIIISILIVVTSGKPIIYKQERTGKNNKPFTLYKFRTMKNNQDGPLWTTEKDNRITTTGKILRYSHLDEIPQLYNILKGDISFIGPRPERTELVKIYEEIPYYDIRHMIKPGITGWAQLNYKPSASIDEAEKKFQFDLYYLKNRCLTLDLFIIIKTVRMFFQTNK